MDASTGTQLLLALGITGHALAYWFRSPKEESSALTNRQNAFDTRLTTLEISFANSHTYLNTSITHVKEALEELKESVDKLADKLNAGPHNKVTRRARP